MVDKISAWVAKMEYKFLKVSKILTSSPTLGHEPLGLMSRRENQPHILPSVQIQMIL